MPIYKMRVSEEEYQEVRLEAMKGKLSKVKFWRNFSRKRNRKRCILHIQASDSKTAAENLKPILGKYTSITPEFLEEQTKKITQDSNGYA